MLDPAAIGQIADGLLGRQSGHDWEVVNADSHSVILRSGGLIAKYRPPAFRTELAALRYTNEAIPDLTPTLVAASPDDGVIVMSDLGRGRSLADALVSGDATVANEYIDDYVDSMAVLHRATWGEQAPVELLHDRVDSHFSLYSRALEQMRGNESLGNDTLRFAAVAEVEALGDLTIASGPTVFTVGDMCPGNQMMTPDGLKLFDLEASGFMHPALDAAYLTIPFPTCWCAWELPDQIKARALARYLDAVPDAGQVEKRIPDAEVFWTVASVLAGLQLGEEPKLPPELVAPRYREVVAHRIERTRMSPQIRDRFPALSELLDSLGQELERRWGELPPLRLAPAFRD